MPLSNDRNLKVAIVAILLVVTFLVALAVIALPPFPGGVY